jgi:hypothetical protein
MLRRKEEDPPLENYYRMRPHPDRYNSDTTERIGRQLWTPGHLPFSGLIPGIRNNTSSLLKAFWGSADIISSGKFHQLMVHLIRKTQWVE